MAMLSEQVFDITVAYVTSEVGDIADLLSRTDDYRYASLNDRDTF